MKRTFPNINPLPAKKDLGQDATASASVPVRHDNRDYSFAFSLTPTFRKLQDDCRRCREEGHVFDVLVFGAWGKITAGNRRRWIQCVKDTYGWELLIYDMNFLLDEAELKENDDLIADELGVKRLEVYIFAEKANEQGMLIVDNLSPQTRLHICTIEDFNYLLHSSISLANQ